jgi:hypothetical protein
MLVIVNTIGVGNKYREDKPVSFVGELLISLFGGGGVAIVLFWLTNRRDRRKAEERENDERKGLWRLVDMEIYQNRSSLLMIRDSPDVGQLYESYSRLHTQVWDERKVRLAQLLSPEHTDVLGRYYMLLQRLGVTLQDDPFKPSTRLTRKDRRSSKVKQAVEKVEKAQADSSVKRDRLLSVYARDAVELGDEARQTGEGYMGEAPDYFELYKEESHSEN